MGKNSVGIFTDQSQTLLVHFVKTKKKRQTHYTLRQIIKYRGGGESL